MERLFIPPAKIITGRKINTKKGYIVYRLKKKLVESKVYKDKKGRYILLKDKYKVRLVNNRSLKKDEPKDRRLSEW